VQEEVATQRSESIYGTAAIVSVEFSRVVEVLLTHLLFHFVSSDSAGPSKSRCTLIGLSFLNIGLAAMMASLGVLTLIEIHKNGVGDFSEPFLASYMIMFAVLLFVYECMWWKAIPGLNKTLRKNFGFMYGIRGKGLYLIFVAFLCLGLGRDASVKTLNWATGIAYLAGGCLHIFLVCANPLLTQEYIAPTAGLSTNDDIVV
jgi:hypothetical protein